MEPVNSSSVTTFVLLGLSHSEATKIPLFVIFLCIYLFTLLGNFLLMLVVRGDPHLYRPMYLFLVNLSFLDIWLSTVTMPKMLADILEEGKTISFHGCVTQLYFFHFLASTECFLYTVMAYDRYLAICRPLHYNKLMSLKVCTNCVAGVYLTGSVHSMIHTTLTFQLPFCGPNRIDYFFCDIIPILKLVCADTTVNKAMILTNIGTIALICFLFILTSYVHIVMAIMKISTSEGRRKTFSTCASHVITVSMYFGPPVFIYLRPNSINFLVEETIAVFYTLVTPMLNPIIYSLRNKEVKTALGRMKWGKLYV
ncbi:olfactory receptor 10G7-like [Ascaphus truei]|uniref:olfactory receptor 10G7-like n=1 Tax=Ascaphus truei TaxID=8439 RepID=UPI003F59E060